MKNNPGFKCGNCIVLSNKVSNDILVFDTPCLDGFLMKKTKYVSKPGFKLKCPVCDWFVKMRIERGDSFIHYHIDFLSDYPKQPERIMWKRRELMIRQSKRYSRHMTGELQLTNQDMVQFMYEKYLIQDEDMLRALDRQSLDGSIN